MNTKILVVGGTFDNNGGKPSGLVNKIFENYVHTNNIEIINGGDLNFLREFIDKELYKYDILFWFANISNEEEKFNNFKVKHPKLIFIESKRNDNNKYSFKELIWHMLKNKANLMLEFSKQSNNNFMMRILDPLGNCWAETDNPEIIGEKIIERSLFLQSIRRQRTINVTDVIIEVPKREDFFEIIRENAKTFSNLINPASEANNRFLGNASFRCENGFPSFRDQTDNKLIFVSQRNINKETISDEGFIPVKYDKNKEIIVYSDRKPSVDTPIQLALYEKYPHINYMLHSHVYIDGAPFTEKNIPCGGLEEIEEVIKTVEKNYDSKNDSFIINLIGHGSLVMAKDLLVFKDIRYISRDIPEKFN